MRVTESNITHLYILVYIFLCVYVCAPVCVSKIKCGHIPERWRRVKGRGRVESVGILVCTYICYSNEKTPAYDCLDVSGYLGQLRISAP